MRFLVNILILLFLIGIITCVLRFVFAMIGVGLSVVWQALPAILIVGAVVWLVNKSRH